MDKGSEVHCPDKKLFVLQDVIKQSYLKCSLNAHSTRCWLEIQLKKWIYTNSVCWELYFYPTEVNFTKNNVHAFMTISTSDWRNRTRKRKRKGRRRDQEKNSSIFWINWIKNFTLLLSSYSFETYMGLLQFSLSLVMAE